MPCRTGADSAARMVDLDARPQSDVEDAPVLSSVAVRDLLRVHLDDCRFLGCFVDQRQHEALCRLLRFRLRDVRVHSTHHSPHFPLLHPSMTIVGASSFRFTGTVSRLLSSILRTFFWPSRNSAGDCRSSST